MNSNGGVGEQKIKFNVKGAFCKSIVVEGESGKVISQGGRRVRGEGEILTTSLPPIFEQTTIPAHREMGCLDKFRKGRKENCE